MKLKLLVPAAALAAGVIFSTLPGIANPASHLSGLKLVEMDQPPVAEKTAWSHGCWWGPGGWHKYVAGVGRVQCTTRKCWINRWGYRRCKWF